MNGERGRIRNPEKYKKAAVKGARLDAAHAPGRNNAVNRIAGSLARAGFGEAEIQQEVIDVADGLPQHEVRSATRSGMKWGGAHAVESTILPVGSSQSAVDFESTTKGWTLSGDSAAELASQLGLPVSCIEAMSRIRHENGEFHIAEWDGSGKAIGALRRTRTGLKIAIAGGRRGLSIPTNFQQLSEANRKVYVVEGPSDTMAIAGGGEACVGKPSNTGGIELLTDFLRPLAPDIVIYIVGENDQKFDDDGQLKQWPGQVAVGHAERLRRMLPGRKIYSTFPPVPFKDCRAYLTTPEFAEIPFDERVKGLCANLTADATPAGRACDELESEAVSGLVNGDSKLQKEIRQALGSSLAFTNRSFCTVAEHAIKIVDAGGTVIRALLADQLAEYGVSPIESLSPYALECARKVGEKYRRSSAIEHTRKVLQWLESGRLSPNDVIEHFAAGIKGFISHSCFPEPTSDLDLPPEETIEFAWQDLLAYGYITLFPATWKSGKSTVSGCLLREMQRGGMMFDRYVHQNQALVLTEESLDLWTRRKRTFGFSDVAHFLSVNDFRDFKSNHESWLNLLNFVEQRVEALRCRVLIIDVLGVFWGNEEENADHHARVSLLPLKQLANRKGLAVLGMFHTAKQEGGKGKLARGSGTISGMVDNLMEFRRTDQNDVTNPQRELTVLGRLCDEPIELVVEYDKVERLYNVLGKPRDVKEVALASYIHDHVLKSGSGNGLTVKEVHLAMVAAHGRGEYTGKVPTMSTLEKTLPNGTMGENPRWQRSSGTGGKRSPYRYFLE